YYGRNLDAMHDCLTDITEETEVVFFGVKACRSVSPEMSAYIDRMERMLEDVSTEDDNLTFILIAENKEDEEITRTAEMGREIVCERNLESIKELLSNLGIGECDCVFVSGFSGSEVIGAVRASGAKMIPVDIVPEGFGIEPRLIDFALEKIKVDGRLTPKAIILSPILGIPPRTEVVNTIAEENNLYVIFESQEQASEEDAEYLARIGDAYKMAFTLRFGKGSSRLWLPRLPKSIRPVWSGFPVRFVDPDKRDEVNKYLVESGVPARLPNLGLTAEEMDLLPVGKKVSETMLVLPVSVDMGAKDIVKVVDGIWEFFGKPEAEEDMNPFSEIADNYTEYGVR
ncbi:MAG: DegT/DnrJ/EryC1/StrS family aminotransferase, partial [Firmicutes bacterium]|nr:DegT/DnrJ/EryC1/StrS family aminotransferase [Bacillota bacterium]